MRTFVISMIVAFIYRFAVLPGRRSEPEAGADGAWEAFPADADPLQLPADDDIELGSDAGGLSPPRRRLVRLIYRLERFAPKVRQDGRVSDVTYEMN